MESGLQKVLGEKRTVEREVEARVEMVLFDFEAFLVKRERSGWWSSVRLDSIRRWLSLPPGLRGPSQFSSETLTRSVPFRL
jgi:hypothetical protein